MATNQADGAAARALRTPRAAAVAGILFALLLATALALVRLAASTDPAGSAAWTMDPGRRRLVIIALNLVPFAGIAFLWFIGVMRDRIGEHEDRFFGTVFLGSGLLFVGMLFVATAATAAVLAESVRAGTGAPGYGRSIGAVVLHTYAMRMAAVFMISTATIGLRTGILSRWLGFSGYAVALVLLLVIDVTRWVELLFPFWILLLSLDTLVEGMRGPAKTGFPSG